VPRLLAAFLVCVLLAACSETHPDQARFDALQGEFLDAYLAEDPVRATELGVHDQDDRWPNLSHEALQRNVESQREWLARVEAISRDNLSGPAYADHRILEYGIRARLLELEEVRSFMHDPNLYNGIVARGLALLIDREFAPLEVRAAALASRLETLPAILDAARENLADVPRIFADLAIRNVSGTTTFIREDLPAALDRQGLAGLPAETSSRVAAAIEGAAAAMEGFERWLRDELLPTASGDFRLGPELFRKKLLYEEHIDIDLGALRRMNDEAIAGYKSWVKREAAVIRPGIPVEQVMREITGRYPAADRLISTASRNVEQAREFVLEHDLVTLPTAELPVVRPTPEFARSSFASMSAPGPFEQVATTAYFNITLPDPAWTEQQQSEHLTYFNYPGLLGIAIHEVMPGHYVQLMYRRQLPTDLRKIFMPASLIEGWAHYTEQMLIDEGLGFGAAALRLGQLRRALQRHARWHVGLAMHVDGKSILDAAIDFAQIAYFDDFPALRETQRGTYNPTYLYYALGRMEILSLREDYRAHLEARGQTFSMRQFHDRILTLGLPLSLAREELIPTRP
jgi:uncharacterized protein (DUF885 family)